MSDLTERLAADRLARAKAAVEQHIAPKPDPYFKRDPQRDRLISSLNKLNDDAARQGFPEIPPTATNEELDLVEVFTENEHRAVSLGPPRNSFTPPYVHWLNAKSAIEYCKG